MASSDNIPEQIELLNHYFIKLFTDSYSNTLGERKRSSYTDTSTQGDLTIPIPTDQTILHIISAIKYLHGRALYEKNQSVHQGYALPLPNDIDFWSKVQLPDQINIPYYTQQIVEKFDFDKRAVLDGIKTFYCYCTGGLLARTVSDGPIVTKTLIQTGCHGPRAEIEHILAWRTMMAIGGNIAEPPKKEKGEDGRENPLHAIQKDIAIKSKDDIDEAYLNVLRKFEKIIAYYGFDPTSHSPSLNTQVMRTLFAKTWGANAAKAASLIVNMDSLIQNGMWYSVRLWNQIKSEACLFRITENTSNNDIRFGISESRLTHMVQIFCSYLYYINPKTPNDLPRQFNNYEEFLKYKYNISPNYQESEGRTIIARLKQQQVNTFVSTTEKTENGITYRFHYLKGNPNYNINITEQEFTYLKRLFQNYSYVEAVNLMKMNIYYVCDNLLVDLNNYKYDRAFFQANVHIFENADGKRGVIGMHKARKKTARAQQRTLAQKTNLSPPSNTSTQAGVNSQLAVPSTSSPFDGTMTDLRNLYKRVYDKLEIADKGEFWKTQGGRKRRRNKRKKKRTRRKKTRKKKTRRKRRRKKKKRTRRKK